MTKSSKVEPSNPKDKTVVLCIIDGFAFGKQNDSGNAVFLAETPNLHAIASQYPHWFYKHLAKALACQLVKWVAPRLGMQQLALGEL